jgi:replication factor A1
VYFFTRGSIKPANKKYASTRNDYEIHFDGRTTIEESADQNASNMVAKLEFVPIDQLAGHVGKKASMFISCARNIIGDMK